MEERHEAEVLSCLSDAHEITREAAGNLNLALMEITDSLVKENLKDAMQGLKYVAGDLSGRAWGGYPPGKFQGALKKQYLLCTVCPVRLRPMEYLEKEYFAGITDFNSLAALTVFGSAASSFTESVLMGIGRTVKKNCLKGEQKSIENRTEMSYNKFNTLKRETESGREESEMELTYHWEGDYLIPDLTIVEEKEPIGKYGMLRKTFLKENRAGWYQGLMLSGKLDGHLAEIEKAALERMEILVKSLLEKYPAPDKGKDQMAWTSHMNNLTAMAEESVLQELVYS